MVRIVVVGDIRMYRDGVAAHLSRDARFSVVATAATRDEAGRCVEEHQPDVVVLDMALGGSLPTVWDVAHRAPSARIVALTVPDVEGAVLACVEAGIAGYVSRDGSLADLTAAIESAMRGECVLPPRIAASLVRRVSLLAADRVTEAAAAALTAREQEIVTLIAEGLSNKQIGARLHIELATVKNHVHNILDKLHVRTRADAVTRVHRLAPPHAFSFDAGGGGSGLPREARPEPRP
jgi:DNA-binding NarL/FixJ family response regulator